MDSDRSNGLLLGSQPLSWLPVCASPRELNLDHRLILQSSSSRQTLALKGFLTSGATIFGFVVGADSVLLNHESQQRSSENLIRNRARAELGRQGIVASESEIEKWKERFVEQKLEERKKRREEALRALDDDDVVEQGTEPATEK